MSLTLTNEERQGTTRRFRVLTRREHTLIRLSHVLISEVLGRVTSLFYRHKPVCASVSKFMKLGNGAAKLL